MSWVAWAGVIEWPVCTWTSLMKALRLLHATAMFPEAAASSAARTCWSFTSRLVLDPVLEVEALHQSQQARDLRRRAAHHHVEAGRGLAAGGGGGAADGSGAARKGRA